MAKKGLAKTHPNLHLRPDLLFLALSVKNKANYLKNARISFQANLQNPWEFRENAQKNKDFLAKEESKEFQQSKERKIGALIEFQWLSLALLNFPIIIFNSVMFFSTGSVSVLFSPLLCQSDLRNLQILHYTTDIFGDCFSGIYSLRLTLALFNDFELEL